MTDHDKARVMVARLRGIQIGSVRANREVLGLQPVTTANAAVQDAADQLSATIERCERLEAERYALAYAICGGEDAPGLLAATGVEHLVKIARDAAASHMETIDRVLRLERVLRSISDTTWDVGAADACLSMIKQDARTALASDGRA